MVSDVNWHEPLKFNDNSMASYLQRDEACSPKTIVGRGEDGPNASLLARSTSGLDIMDYGLLHFTAQTTMLNLRRSKDDNASPKIDEAQTECGIDSNQVYRKNSNEGVAVLVKDRWIKASIQSRRGTQIGTIKVPLSLFDKQSDFAAEFVLISSHAEKISDEKCKKVVGDLDCGTIVHVHDCKHIQSRNLMLIEWDGDITYRQGICKIAKDWTDISTQTRTIVLG